MSTANLPSATLDTLRGAQLREAAETLDRVADKFAALAELADKTDPLGDLACSIQVVRDDMDALEALGYGEPPAA